MLLGILSKRMVRRHHGAEGDTLGIDACCCMGIPKMTLHFIGNDTGWNRFFSFCILPTPLLYVYLVRQREFQLLYYLG